MAKNIYNLRDYADFSEADAAKKKKESAESSVANYGDFQYGRQDVYDKAIDAIINTKPFEYNLNTDALYDQYKNQYQALGKLAMQDTMGQAAAMTGGYGNSYAATAGNQAYQSYLSQLNDVIPQLYQMALDRYNTERDVANSTMSALSADRSTQYGEWNDRYNRLLTERDYAGNEYNNALNLAHQLARNAIADEQDFRDFNYQKGRDAVADSQWQKTYDRGVYEYDTNLAYQKARDAVADSQWQKTYDRGVYEYDTNLAYQKERDEKKDENEDKGNDNGFTGTTYSEAVAYMKANGVDGGTASGIMTKGEFARWSNKGEFKNYKDYLNYIVEYKINPPDPLINLAINKW